MFPRFVFISSTLMMVLASGIVNGHGEPKPLKPGEYSKALSLLNSMLRDAGLPAAARLNSGTMQRTSGVIYRLHFENVNYETCTASFLEERRKNVRQIVSIPPGVSCSRVM